MQNRNDSADSANNDKIRAAKMLEAKLAQDKTCTIEGELIFKEVLNEFKTRQGLTESLKVGDLIVHS